MSYGVLWSAAATVRVERTTGGRDAEHPFEKALLHGAGRWMKARVTMSPTKLTFMASVGDQASPMTALDLGEVQSVSITPGRLHRVVTVRFVNHDLHLRMPNAADYAKRIAVQREAVQQQAYRSAVTGQRPRALAYA